jgi:hypothetical protein
MSSDRKCVELKVDGDNTVAVLEVSGVVELEFRVGDEYTRDDADYNATITLVRDADGIVEEYIDRSNIHYGGTGWWCLSSQDEQDLEDQIKEDHFQGCCSM